MKTGRIALFVLLLAAAAVLAACGGGSAEKGWLVGHVAIGPLSPVAREGEAEATPSPDVYASRQVVVSDPDSGREVVRVGLDTTGSYGVELPAGTYVVDINRSGIDTAAGLPTTVEIRPGEETRLDIAIDTGIR